MAGVVIWAGGVAPESYVLELSSVTGVDLSTVTAATLRVRDPAGGAHEWDVDMSYDVDTGVLTLSHEFDAETPEITRPGMWSAYAQLTVPTGTVRSSPRGIFVKEKFAVGT